MESSEFNDRPKGRRSDSYKPFKPASKAASATGRGNKRVDTKPERLLRSALHAAGLRYRVNMVNLPGRPDIAFTKARIAVFCDGDFWHGRNWEVRERKLSEGHNAEYWIPKIRRNMVRDIEVDLELKGLGWTVLRVWESDVLNDLPAVVRKVFNILGINR